MERLEDKTSGERSGYFRLRTLYRSTFILVPVSLCIILYLAEWIPNPVMVKPSRPEIYDSMIQVPLKVSGFVPPRPTQRKLILFWNGFYGDTLWFGPPGQKRFIDLKCFIKNCEVTADKKLFNKSDAVGFHIATVGGSRPPHKLLNQRWIFFMMESPCGKYMNYASLNGLINWTMTYRLDSDIPFPYGEYYKRPTPIRIDFKAVVKKKRKMVAWLVSNCNSVSKRMDYAKELSKYIQVDIWGGCGRLKCGAFAECRKILERDYKFYLAFESRLSPDYVTEKFYRILSINIVPVVRGSANYSDPRVAPPGSFISTQDFKNPKALADYLQVLDKNDTMYIEYFKWKQTHNSAAWRYSPETHPYCKLCSKLNDPTEPNKVYERVDKFWDHPGHCFPPNDVNFV